MAGRAAADRRRRRLGKGGAARQRSSATGRGRREQAVGLVAGRRFLCSKGASLLCPL
jgi:hypothetical protein